MDLPFSITGVQMSLICPLVPTIIQVLDIVGLPQRILSRISLLGEEVLY